MIGLLLTEFFMDFGDLGRLKKGLDLANNVATTEPVIEMPPRRFRNAPMVESTSRVRGMEPSFDDLLGDVTRALTECANPIIPATSAVAQKDFVGTATKAREAAVIKPSVKKELPSQEPAGLIDIEKRGNEFKKYIAENLSTPETTAFVEAVSKVFDIMVLGKMG